ncbi:hypothetical protein ADK76_13720 [Streptomyces griseoflavus]|nr:hypothetical protein ADK76_13720 [Streptomyces griseoflavus]
MTGSAATANCASGLRAAEIRRPSVRHRRSGLAGGQPVDDRGAQHFAQLGRDPAQDDAHLAVLQPGQDALLGGRLGPRRLVPDVPGPLAPLGPFGLLGPFRPRVRPLRVHQPTRGDHPEPAAGPAVATGRSAVGGRGAPHGDERVLKDLAYGFRIRAAPREPRVQPPGVPVVVRGERGLVPAGDGAEQGGVVVISVCPRGAEQSHTLSIAPPCPRGSRVRACT